MPTSAEREKRLKELEEELSPSTSSASRRKRLEQLEVELSNQPKTSPQRARRLAELENEEKRNVFNLVRGSLRDFANEAKEQFTRVHDIYEEERKSGRATVEQSYKQPSITSPLRALAGTAQYTFSPLTAIGKGVFGEPVKETTGSEFLGSMAEQVPYLFPAGQVAKAKMLTPAQKAADTALKTAPKAIPPTEAIEPLIKKELSPALKKSIAGKGQAFTKKVSDNVVKNITEASVESLRGNWDGSRRLFREITDRLGTGEIHPSMVPGILKKYDLTPAQFAREYQETVSSAGRILGYHGQAAKQLQMLFKNEPEALKIFGNIADEQRYMGDIIMEGWNKVEGFRRGMLVTQVATAMRNAWSQVGRISVSTLDEALQGAIRGTVGGQGNTFSEVRNGLNAFTAAYNRMSPKGRARLNSILDSQGAAISQSRLLSQPVHEVTLGNRVSKALNTLNRAQEMMFRKLAFESKLRQLLKREGLDYNTVDPKRIPRDLLEKSVDYGLEMSFAASPKSKAGRDIVNAWTKIPGLTTVNPFPRFAFANALPFILEHSPLGYLGAMSPKVLKELASGNPARFAKMASRATIGSLMLDQAWRFRQSKYAGEKWYELNVGDKTVDLRAYAPFSTYFMLAEAFINPSNLSSQDYAQLAIGLNRVAGTGLVFTDLLRAQSGESAGKVARNFVGSYIGSFSVPARTIKDVYSAIDPEEGVYRDVRSDPIRAPFLKNLPEISQMIPESISPYTIQRSEIGREKTAGIPKGVFRQLTGFYSKIKPTMKREVDRINLPFTRIYPRTGVHEADRKILEYMAPFVEEVGVKLINTRGYKNFSVSGKRLALAEVFREAKAHARRTLNIKNPGLSALISIEGMSDDMKRFLTEQGKFDNIEKVIKGLEGAPVGE